MTLYIILPDANRKLRDLKDRINRIGILVRQAAETVTTQLGGRAH